MLAGVTSPLIGQYSAYQLTVEHVDLKLPRWDAPGLKLGFISDFHLTAEGPAKRAIQSVQLTFRERPDLIVLGGDYIERNTDAQLKRLDQFLAVFADSPCPVVAIMGNHDYWSKGAAEVFERFSKSPVELLRNQVYDFHGVSVVGIDDYIDRKAKFDFFPEGAVSRSLIALMHEPDVVRRQPPNVSLQLSGHSHGGQVCLPFGKHLHTPGWARDYVKGYYPKAKVPLYVSRGVGTTGIDARFFCPPEVTILKIS